MVIEVVYTIHLGVHAYNSTDREVSYLHPPHHNYALSL